MIKFNFPVARIYTKPSLDRPPNIIEFMRNKNLKKEKYFLSGHLDLTLEEFDFHYKPQIDAILQHNPLASFIVGVARGADTMAQQYLSDKNADVIVYHMFESPRNNAAKFSTCSGFETDETRDSAMTQASTHDIAWVRPGRETSGTAKNLQRRLEGLKERLQNLLPDFQFKIDDGFVNPEIFFLDCHGPNDLSIVVTRECDGGFTVSKNPVWDERDEFLTSVDEVIECVARLAALGNNENK
jgi:hypothetical protein